MLFHTLLLRTNFKHCQIGSVFLIYQKSDYGSWYFLKKYCEHNFVTYITATLVLQISITFNIELIWGKKNNAKLIILKVSRKLAQILKKDERLQFFNSSNFKDKFDAIKF